MAWTVIFVLVGLAVLVADADARAGQLAAASNCRDEAQSSLVDCGSPRAISRCFALVLAAPQAVLARGAACAGRPALAPAGPGLRVRAATFRGRHRHRRDAAAGHRPGGVDARQHADGANSARAVSRTRSRTSGAATDAPEVATDAGDVQRTDIFVSLKPRGNGSEPTSQDELVELMQEAVGRFARTDHLVHSADRTANQRNGLGRALRRGLEAVRR